MSIDWRDTSGAYTHENLILREHAARQATVPRADAAESALAELRARITFLRNLHAATSERAGLHAYFADELSALLDPPVRKEP